MPPGKKTLPRDNFDHPLFPDVAPTTAEDLLDLMDDAADYASRGAGTGAPAFDHGSRLFSQLSAHYQVTIARELAEVHNGLKTATNALKVATWWLAAVTILLGAVEMLKFWRGH